MPKAKDLTHDLHQMRGRRSLQNEIPTSVVTLERRLAFNPWSTFFWLLVAGFVLIEFGLLLWLI